MSLYKNGEGYRDLVAGTAIKEADKPPKHVLDVLHVIRTVASLAGFEIKGRICLKDKTTGREYR